MFSNDLVIRRRTKFVTVNEQYKFIATTARFAAGRIDDQRHVEILLAAAVIVLQPPFGAHQKRLRVDRLDELQPVAIEPAVG